MHKRIVVICLVLTLLTTLVTTAPVYASKQSLSAPAGVTVSVEGTQLKVKWKNPTDVIKLAQSAYNNYNGEVLFIVDWRVNNGAWHFDQELPEDQDFFTYYYDLYNIEMSFSCCGQLCDGSDDIEVPQTIIDKVLLGVPNKTPIKELLKKNNVELRGRYLYDYYDRELHQEKKVSCSVLFPLLKS